MDQTMNESTNELKKNTLAIVNQINQDWVNAVQDAKKANTALDVTAIMGRFSENITKLDQHFRDHEERMVKITTLGKKRGFFGG